MINVWTIARREFKHYFVSPLAYAIAFLIFVVLGVIFYANLSLGYASQQPPDPTAPLGPLVTIYLFAVPAVTMRLLADEQRMGTIELLLTAPLRDWELVVGKWLGALLFNLVILAGTLIYPFIVNSMTDPGIDQGTVLATYLGLTLLLSAMLAIGVFFSSLFSNQFAAFFVTLGGLLLLWIVAFPVQNASGPLADVLRYLQLSDHYFNNLYRGVIDTTDLLYFLSLTALFLFLGTRMLETRRWR